ncbi:MAG: histidine kinase [Pseudomonadota bacterium]
MKRLLLVLCLLFQAAAWAKAPASLADVRFQLRDGDFQQCGQPATLATNGQRDFDVAQVRAGHHYCLASQFEMAAAPEANQVLFISALAASELYLDGVRVGTNGVAGTDAGTEIPGQIDYSASLTPDQLRPGKHQLQLKLSTYHGATGLRQQFYDLSILDQAGARAAHGPKYVLALMLAGALALVAFMFAGLTLFYQRASHWIVFLFLCLAASVLLMVEVWRNVAGYGYPLHIVRLNLVLLLGWMISVLLPLYFLMAFRFRQVLPITASLALAMTAPALLCPYYDAKSAYMFLISLVASAVINVIAFRRGLGGSKTGLIVVFLSIAVFLAPGQDFSETGFALVVCFLLLSILVQMVTQFTRDREKAALATQLENQLLRRSLQPHFLMNSLALVGELVHQSPAQAQEFIEALGGEFRMLSDFAQRRTIALSEELGLCRNYLAIMSARLQIACRLHVSGNAAAIALPPAILLTTLENAFSHNKYRQDADFTLHIAAAPGTSALTLLMPLANRRVHAGTGTGSNYIRQSLAEVFGGKAHYSAGPEDNFWRVRLELPA